MTRADARDKVRWKFMEVAADHEVRFILALWLEDYSLAEIETAMAFVRARNAEALTEAMKQVES